MCLFLAIWRNYRFLVAFAQRASVYHFGILVAVSVQCTVGNSAQQHSGVCYGILSGQVWYAFVICGGHFKFKTCANLLKTGLMDKPRDRELDVRRNRPCTLNAIYKRFRAYSVFKRLAASVWILKITNAKRCRLTEFVFAFLNSDICLA